MIDVDECSLHIGENFDLILELLADIVRLPQRRISVHDDINFYEIILEFIFVSLSMIMNLRHIQVHSAQEGQ